MTSSNPPQSLRHPSSPLLSRTGIISPRGLAHLPPSSRFPSHLPLEPFHTTTVSLVLLHARARPPPTYILILLTSSPSSRSPALSFTILRISRRSSLVCPPLFLSPSSSPFLLPFPAFRPYELSTGAIPMDKSGDGPIIDVL